MSSQACAACGAENAPGALFCGRCGSRVGRKCPACGAVVAPDVAFCTSCGVPFEPEVPASTEERKVVSVLFADLVGFTARAETLDPEEVRGFLAPYYARVRAELERFGGTVEKFIGDAAMALFGAPLAHEDDSERAVRAALAVREAIGELNASQRSPALQIRIGITTGEALVTRDARPSQGEGMAAGDVVNTAARLQAGAPVDGILVDEATYRATEHAIEYRPGDAVVAKGKAEPVPAWEAVAPRARLGVDIAFRGGAALVGRDEELDALRDALARARRERTAQLVTLVGVPGIGKSRLVYELWATLEADPELVYWRQGRSLPYGDGVSLWALGEMMKAQAGILESDSAEAAEEKLRAAVAHVLADPSEAGWVEAHLRPLVGLSGEPPGGDRRGESFAAWRRFLEALAEQHPLVLVFEDLHWADEGLLEFVDHLVDWSAEVPLLVVCTARPELLERRVGWGGGKRNAATLSLSPLSDEDTSELVQTLVGELHPELVAHAGGNPLYAEEYARMLAQSGNGHTLALPDSVQGIIAARLDTLPIEEKTLVQDAAVLGKVFWVGELGHVAALPDATADDRLHALERKEFIRRERRSSVAGETAYVFRHSLVRDVAYSQIPRTRRVEKHRLAAEWVESLAGDRREDLADVVAHHYLSALELARAAGQDTNELAERARFALREAGDRAAALSALEAAERFYSEALALWPHDDAERPHLLLRYGRVLFPHGRGDDVLATAAEELLDAGDREAAAEAETLLGDVLWLRGLHDEAFEHLEGAVALLTDEEPSRAKAFALADLARFRMMGDDAEQAVRAGSEALEMAEELELDDLKASALNTLGVCRVMTGDFEGLVNLEQAIEISRGLRSFQLVRGLNNLASTLSALGELDRAHGLYTEAQAAAERVGWTAAVEWIEAEQADWHYHHGQWDEALAVADAIVTEPDPERRSLRHVREVDARVIRALIRLARGDDAGANEDSATGLEFAEGFWDPQILFPALACRARVLLETGSAAEADSTVGDLLQRWQANPITFADTWLAYALPTIIALERGDELAEISKSASVKTRWLEAALALTDGDPREAAHIFARIGSLPDEAYARLRAAEVLAATGRRGEADQELGPALDFFRAVGATRYVREGETLLAPG
jgi:class 3 adenylate cyclase/tetratricopeptide (TPR) repeat protein